MTVSTGGSVRPFTLPPPPPGRVRPTHLLFIGLVDSEDDLGGQQAVGDDVEGQEPQQRLAQEARPVPADVGQVENLQTTGAEGSNICRRQTAKCQ